ncbi:MAG: MmgE/PrpD family protein, partial [Burkholderiales bacterium]|nr:MmgE/PrpD family protein [Burkholderiales bacterium]
AAHLLPLDAQRTREALGIAEYHGPRSPMMRCIDHPTMVKDGSAWGCLAGLSAGYLAERGFTGAPASTVEQLQLQDLWGDLGARWRILEQYFKPHPVCRWAHPAIDAALALARQHGLASGQIRAVRVKTFHHATRLAHACPQTTEQAQYSLQFPVAAALVHGEVDFATLDGVGLGDAEVLRLARLMRVEEWPPYSARFPGERIAEVCVETADGRCLESGPTRARGDPDLALGAAALRANFRHSFAAASAPGLATELEDCVSRLGADEAPVAPLLDRVLDKVRV